MLEVLEQLVGNETIPSAVADKLKSLTPGTVCQHKSWGIGRIQSWDVEGGRLVVDFPGKSGHLLEFGFAALSLKPFAAEHIETLIVTEPETVKELVRKAPVDLMARVVRSLGAGATADRIEATLSPRLIAAEEWKKWWDGAKRAMRKDARFEVPVRRTLPVVFHEEAPDVESRAVEGVLQGVGPKAKTRGLEQLTALWKKSPQPETVDPILKDVDETLEKVPSSQSHAALELIMARRDFLLMARPGSPSVPPNIKAFLPMDPVRFMSTIEELPAAKQGQCVALAREYFGERWGDFASQLLSVANSKVAEVVIEGFRETGRVQEAVVIMERLVAERKLHYDFLIWLCRNRKGEFGRLVDANLFYTILSVLEMEQLGGSRKAGRLERLLFSDKALMGDMLETATQEQVREVTRAILGSPAFADLDKRSLLASVVKRFPYVQDMISGSGDRSGQDAGASMTKLIVSWESLQRRREELEELVTKKIPQNSRDIAVARSYGDLRENAEFKAAKEMQSVLMRRKGELELMLSHAQGTDFRNVDATRVGAGTVVELVPVGSGGAPHRYTILGAWDSQPEKGIISYQTVVAQALIGHTMGEELDLILEDGHVERLRITSIAPYEAPSGT